MMVETHRYECELFYTIVFLFLLSSIIGCQSTDQSFDSAAWQQKNDQILDSLATATSTTDSIIVLSRFAHRDIAHGAPEINCDEITSLKERQSWTSKNWYKFILRDSMSAFCGCNAEFFQKLIEDYMSDNVLVHGYSIGIPDRSIGHYIPLIELKKGEQHELFLVDPMFNAVYQLKNGQIADLRYLIYLVRKNRTDLFEQRSFNDKSSYLLRFKVDSTYQQAAFDLRFPFRIDSSKNNLFPYKLRARRTLDNFLKVEFAETYQEIARYHGGKSLSYNSEEDFRYCLTYMKDVYGPNADAIELEIRYYLQQPISRLDSIFSTEGAMVNYALN